MAKKKSQDADSVEVPVQFGSEPKKSDSTETAHQWLQESLGSTEVPAEFKEAFDDATALDEVRAQRDGLTRLPADTARDWLEKKKELDQLNVLCQQLSCRLHIGTPYEAKSGAVNQPASQLESELLGVMPTVKKPRTRQNLLTPLIEEAGKTCDYNAAKTYSLLRAWSKEGRDPFNGKEDGGLKWNNDKEGEGTLTLERLRDRLRRAKKRDSTR